MIPFLLKNFVILLPKWYSPNFRPGLSERCILSGMLKFTMNSYKSGSLSVLFPELCVASGTLVQHHAPGSPESVPAKR